MIPITDEEWRQGIGGVVMIRNVEGVSLPVRKELRATKATRQHGLRLDHTFMRMAVEACHVLIRLSYTDFRIMYAHEKYRSESYWIGPIFDTYHAAEVAFQLL